MPSNPDTIGEKTEESLDRVSALRVGSSNNYSLLTRRDIAITTSPNQTIPSRTPSGKKKVPRRRW
jgi:hypothetical protein